jgi:hypothetical protein
VREPPTRTVGTVQERILALLADGQPKKLGDIVAALGGHAGTVREKTWTLRQIGKLRLVSRGVYVLATRAP